MDIRPGKHQQNKRGVGRGSGPGERQRRSDALGERKDVIIRVPEKLARQLKIVTACEDTTMTDFCLRAIIPQIDKALEKYGLQHSR
jgi:hypothetical protein